MMFKTPQNLAYCWSCCFYCSPSLNKCENVIKCNYCVEFSDKNHTYFMNKSWCPKQKWECFPKAVFVFVGP